MRRICAVSALVALCALAAGCGKSKEHQLYDERHDTCDRVGRDHETVRQAANDFGLSPFTATGFISCRPDLVLAGKPPCGEEGQLLCRRYWQWIANDDALCSPNGCIYVCEAYSPPVEATALVDDSVICATRFVGGQPFFF